jgi:hypothetical protein
MNKGQTKKVVEAAKEAEKPPAPYKPTPTEAKAIAAYKAAKETRGPRLKVAIEGDAAKTNPDHPDPAIGTLALMRAIGTADLDFFDGLTLQLVNASKGQGSPEKAVNFMLAVIKGIEPRDQIEAMLAAQMAAVHNATMIFARRLAHVENIPQQDSAANAFNKLTAAMSAGVKVKWPSDRPLTADEVDADPSILRHPDAPQRTRNRSGQKGGASKARFPDHEPHIRLRFCMMESPAWKALSLSARRVLDRIEIEFGRRKGNPEANGDLIVTYDDFVAYGITRRLVRPALNEVIALGFVRVTRMGAAGNADDRMATMYLITYQHAGSAQYVEDNWKRIKTDEEAEAIAKAARKRKGNVRARELGRRRAVARWAKNANPVTQSVPSPVTQSVPKSGQNGALDVVFPVAQSVPPSRISRGRAFTIPATVWPIASAYLLSNGHRFETFASPRHVVRSGWVLQ